MILGIPFSFGYGAEFLPRTLLPAAPERRLKPAPGTLEHIARLGNTDLDVFGLCLGGNVFGWTIDEQRSFEVLDAYVAAGGNFIDTADTYGRRGADGPGASERIIGRWIAARGNRERLVVATKVGSSPELRGLSHETIMRACEASLQRLGIDRIDLYYAHQDDPSTPLQDTLGAFGELIADGRVRYVGASNYSAGRLQDALCAGETEGAASYVALQPHYNLLERDYETELRAVCQSAGLACMPYFGLARGFLTGKYRAGGPDVDSPRAAGVRDSYFNERGFAVLQTLDEVAAAHASTPGAVALAWLLAQPTVLAPIASATSPQQLAELVPATELQLTDEELVRLGEASAPRSSGA
jgi:aryl-alcohol dehydrogenase-like predicted oxidoreductase